MNVVQIRNSELPLACPNESSATGVFVPVEYFWGVLVYAIGDCNAPFKKRALRKGSDPRPSGIPADEPYKLDGWLDLEMLEKHLQTKMLDMKNAPRQMVIQAHEIIVKVKNKDGDDEEETRIIPTRCSWIRQAAYRWNDMAIAVRELLEDNKQKRNAATDSIIKLLVCA